MYRAYIVGTIIVLLLVVKLLTSRKNKEKNTFREYFLTVAIVLSLLVFVASR